MVSANIVLPWGPTRREGGAPHTLIEEGPNFVVYKRVTDTPFALAWTGEKTVYKLQRDKNVSALINWAKEQAGAAPAPEPEPKPEEEKAFFRIDSEPAGGKVYIDDVDTGYKTWTPKIEVSPGRHKIEVRGIEGFVDTHIFRTARAGETREISVTMAPTPPEVPPEIPPPEVPPEAPPEKPWYNVLGDAAVRFWASWLAGNISERNRAAEEITTFYIGTPEAQRAIGLVPKVEWEPWELAMSLTTIGPAVVTTAKPITQLAAKEILAQGLKDPKKLAAAIKATPKEQIAQLFGKLSTTPTGRKAIETVFRVVLDGRTTLTKWKVLKIAAGAAVGLFGLVHTLNFLGFLGEEAIQTKGIGVFTLISNKLWKEAAVALPSYKASVDAIATGVDALAAIPVLSVFLNAWWPLYKAAAYGQIEDYDTLIKENLKVEEVGSIAVETTPTGATIWVNDTQHKYPSNSIVDKLTPGKYTVRVELKGHVEYENGAEVKTGEQTPFIHEFEAIPEKPVPGSGRIEWETKDRKTGATVGTSWYINGRLEKSYSTGLALDLDPGAYEMRWTAVGYEDYLDTIALEKDKTLVLVIEMDKIEVPPEPPPTMTCETLGYHTEKPEDGKEYEQVPVRGLLCWQLKVVEKGRLEVNSNVEAQIFIGGQDTSKKTPDTFDLTQGIYSVSLQAEGYKPRSTTTLIKPGEPTVVFLELTAEEEPPPKRRLARVSVNSSPTGAKILVNGVWTKQYTPDSVLLEAGDYEIALTKSGYKQWSTPLRLTEE